MLVFPVAEVLDGIVSVGLEVELAAAEVADRAEHQLLGVALLLEEIADREDVREEGFLRVHRVLIDGDLQRKSGGLCEHGAHRPGRTWHGVPTVEGGCRTRKVFMLLGDLRELRDRVLREGAARGLVGEGHLGGLHEDVDEVPLLLREAKHHILRVDVVIVDEAGGLELRLDVGADVEVVPGIEHGEAGGEEGGEQCERDELPVVLFMTADDEDRDEDDRDDRGRNRTFQDILVHHRGAGALERREEVIQDLIHGELRPGIHQPAQAEQEKGGKK